VLEVAIERQPSCADANEPGLLSVEQARQAILDHVKPIAAYEKLPLRNCLNRVLAEDIVSSINVPGHINSAMDGYAVSSDDLPSHGMKSLEIIGTSFAGKPYTGQCQPGQCVRIMTGAAMPEGTDTVIMQEHARRENNTVSIDSKHRGGQNVRQAGEDIRSGDSVLPAGKQVTPADLGIIASLGIGEVKIRKRPCVAFFSTGDELRSIGDGSGKALSKGEVYDSNRYSLYGMLRRLGVDLVDMGVIPDNEAALTRALEQARDVADLVITSGGVSVGEADYIKPVLEKMGRINFWKIAMKPGRPLTFGLLDNKILFGLPGNPVAVMVTFYQFVRPAILYLTSGHYQPPLTLTAISQSKLRKRPGRYEFQRGVLSQSSDGKLRVEKTGRQGSGVLMSMSLANCFILLDEDNAGIEPGEPVAVQPFDSFI
jgi:molybdopterin molybdotransferase